MRRRLLTHKHTTNKRGVDNELEEIDVNVSFSKYGKRQRKQTFKKIYLTLIIMKTIVT